MTDDRRTHEENGKPPRSPDWKAISRTPEARIFAAGLGCAGVVAARFLHLAASQPRKAAALLGVVTAHLTGGRASGVVVAVNSGRFSRVETIAVGSLVEGAVVCIFFAVFCLSCKKLLPVPFLHDAIRNVHRSAESRRRSVLRWGIPGLLVFVWFPFLMTGPVVGSVIGYLIGLRPWPVILVVMAGTVSAIVSWTFAVDRVVEWTGAVGDLIPMLLVCLLVIALVGYRLKRYREAADGGADAEHEAPRTGDDS